MQNSQDKLNLSLRLWSWSVVYDLACGYKNILSLMQNSQDKLNLYDMVKHHDDASPSEKKKMWC
jgi:hypothetical protein